VRLGGPTGNKRNTQPLILLFINESSYYGTMLQGCCIHSAFEHRFGMETAMTRVDTKPEGNG
jgi:hypothetical protein